MIGPKKLSTIREEVRQALTASADDPIDWLEERMAAPTRGKSSGAGKSEVLQSLRRILEAAEGRPRHSQRVGTNK